MNGDVFDAAWELVQDHGLHDAGLPVPLNALEDLYVPVYEDLWDTGVAACAIPPSNGMPTRATPAHIVMDRSLPPSTRRLFYAHEIGHVICEHPGSLRARHVDPWFHDRHEREAWEVAALFLIPPQVFAEGWTKDQMATACEVPRQVFDLYPQWW